MSSIKRRPVARKSSWTSIRRKPVSPDYGRRLLPSVIDERATVNHQRPYASIPNSTDVKDGFRDVTYRTFANAINRCAAWLKGQVGPSANFEVIVYIGPSDLRYQILCMAATKVGYVTFLVSPRNSMDAFHSLLEEARAKKLVAPSDALPIVSTILAERPNMERLVMPELSSLLDETPVKAIPFKKSFEEYRMKPWILLHTSGSTGIPKVVIIRHGYACTLDAYHQFGSEVFKRSGNCRVFNPFPPFHMAGIMWTLPIIIFIDSTIVFSPVVPLTADLVNSIHVSAGIEYSSLPPSVLIELAKNEAYLKNLGGLRSINFAGGPLGQAIGDLVLEHVSIGTSYGSTEMFAPPLLPKAPENWSWHCFNTEQSGIEFREEEGGLHELVIVRDPKLDLTQAIFVTFPDLQEYHSKDLFSRHPTEQNLWKYEGRLDDIIVFSSGEKINPVTMEGMITGCPELKGALIVGQGRFQSALIAEANNPPTSNAERKELVDAIWPSVQKANATCIAHGRISKGLIMFTEPGKPLARAGKGTIQRAKSVATYARETDELYKHFDLDDQRTTAQLDLHNLDATKHSLQQYIANETGLKHIGSSEDLFGIGMDSLQVISLVHAVNASLPDRDIDARQVYENSTLSKLAVSLQAPVAPLRDDDDDLETWLQMQQIYRTLAANLPKQEHATAAANGLPLQGNDRSSSDEKDASQVDGSSSNPMSKTHRAQRRSRRLFDHTSGGLPGHPYVAANDEEFLISMMPPDGGTTAWLQVLASFLINLNNWGLVNSFGVFQAFYETDLLAGHSASTIAWIGTIQGALLLVIGVFSGPLFDRGHFRMILVGAGITIVFALMMLSLATKYYQVMLSQGILVGLCCGLLYIPSVALMPLYFKDRRGLALGLATSGASIGGVLYPVIFRRLLNELGFPWATRIIGFMALATLATAALITRPLSQVNKPVRQLFDMSAFREVPFVAFMASAFLLFCGILIPFFLTPVFASTALHTSENTAFYLLAVINASQFFGRTIPAFVSDYTGGEIMLFVAEVVAAILGLCWIAVHNLGGFTAFLILYGFASGLLTTLPAVVMPYVCPSLAVIGTRLGMVYATAGVGALIGVPIATAAASDTGGFLGAQLWMGLCMLMAAVFFVPTGIAAWRQRRAVNRPFGWKSHSRDLEN